MRKKQKEQNDLATLHAALVIDKNDLDSELVRQPHLYAEAGEAHVQALSARELEKERMKRTDAELDLKFRQQKETAEEKYTENVIASLVQRSDEHIQAVERYRRACLKTDQYAVLREAFQQRSYVLKDLAQLYMAGYWGNASVQGEEHQGARDRQATSNRKKLSDGRRSLGRRNSS